MQLGRAFSAVPDGCVGKLISALTPKLEGLGYTDFIQGNQKVMLHDLLTAAASATENPDGFLDRLVEDRYEKLTAWAAPCTSHSIELQPGALATVAYNSLPQQTGEGLLTKVEL
jgi:hypothetical protein